MKRSIKALFVVAALVGGAWLYYLSAGPAAAGRSESSPAVVPDVPAGAVENTRAARSDSAAPEASLSAARHYAPDPVSIAQVEPMSVPPVSDAAAQPQNPEVLATRRMYGAHAPLRTPEVADPDSEANRQILQTMVEKALQRTTEIAPAPPSSSN